jgi:hypothetical protein
MTHYLFEEWRDVPSAPDMQASSLGRVRVKPYKRAMPNGGVRTYGGDATYGVLRDGRMFWQHAGRNYRVHRLVCEAFNGLAPDGMTVCMHLDENALNNLPLNLAWGTQKENLNAPGFIAYCRRRVGDKSTHSRAKKTSGGNDVSSAD